jgi:hypothetical protein
MLSRICLAACVLSLTASSVFSADNSRKWQFGTLLETEKQRVLEGSTERSHSERNGDWNDGSRDRTSTTTDNYDNFQVYTIRGDRITYVVRERLLFPWSKPASVTVGAKLKFAVEKNTVYLLGDDGKQHKAGLSKASMNPGQ